MKSKVLNLEHKLSQSEAHVNDLDQYNRRNNLEIQGIPSNVSDDALEDKVVDISRSLNINLSKHDIEDCHRLGKADPKNTTVQFVNRKFCYEALDNKLNLRKVDMTKLGFQAGAILYFNENLTHYNQGLAEVLFCFKRVWDGSLTSMKWVKLTERDKVFVCTFIHIYLKRFIACYTWGNYQTLKEIILA